MDKQSRLDKAQEYQDDKYVKSCLAGLSERTQTNYLEGFAEWYAFMGMTPTQMYEKRLRDTVSANQEDRVFFEHKFREYKKHIEQLGIKAISVKSLLIVRPINIIACAVQ